jgi:thymidylate synthase (FAD)
LTDTNYFGISFSQQVTQNGVRQSRQIAGRVDRVMFKVTKINLEGDALVVNSARVSFDKDHEIHSIERDEKLIEYLVNHEHWSPLSHPRYRVHITGGLDNETIEELLTSPIHGLSWGSSWYSDHYAVNTVTGSLWGLLWFGLRYSSDLLDKLEKVAPLSTKAFVKRYASGEYFKGYQCTIHPGYEDHPDTVFTFRIEAPIIQARQLWKHQVGLTFSEDFGWNEVSGRYIDMDKAFDTFVPSTFRGPPTNGAKQGSSSEEVVQNPIVLFGNYSVGYKELADFTNRWYKANPQICNEQRRGALMQTHKTAWYWTATRKRWEEIIKLRRDPHAQLETRLIVEEIERLINEKG